ASYLVVLGAGGAEVSLIVGAGSSSKSPLTITSHRLCDYGWRNVLFCHLTVEFFLIKVSTQALIPLVGSFYKIHLNFKLAKSLLL
ncbi:hypothetical protein Tco_0175864, partial [Tanacetum coccineum]